ncbi:MAG: prepilin-type N-terminal cleavage/methylation domain-containing protein [Alkalibacterium sp.]|nr:prepilin-type N-terminal cleavage/methylation domain-containing protein [Alkalibacterium sp.]
MSHINKDDGMTLIETLLVLSVVSLLLALPTIHFNSLTKKTETAIFFDSFQSSMTLVQNYSVLNDVWTVVRFRPSRGEISFRVSEETGHPIEHILTLPEHVKILNTTVEFRFSKKSGSIGYYETIYFETPEGYVDYVFQLGSGRFEIRTSQRK